MNRLICWVLGHQAPDREPLGFRCPRCGQAEAELEDLGWGASYVSPNRPTFSRTRYENSGVVRP